MKTLIAILFVVTTSVLGATDFDRHYLRTDESGKGYLLVWGEPLSQSRLRTLSAWDLMEVIQQISHTEMTLSSLGNNDEMTAAWRERLVDFAASANRKTPDTAEDIFDPELVLWDPGVIQFRNEWGEWTINIGGRWIVQSDLKGLSPIEVQRAVSVLTARSYDLNFVLEHLEQFRAQLTIAPRPVR